MRARRPLLSLALTLALAACSSEALPPDGAIVDTGLTDLSTTDLGSLDSSTTDGGVDAGSDAGVAFDAGPSMCTTLTLVTACDGTTRTVMGRPYCVHVPPGYHDGTAVPLVMMLHGYTADGESQSAYLGLNDVSDVRTFLLVKPNGTLDGVGLRYWNATPACCSMFAASPPDDVAYLSAVLDDVESAYSVDTTRVYAMGHSNGAFMSQRMACEHTSRFAAIASLAGAVDPANCAPTAPISFLEVHGDADATIMYGGGMNVGAAAAYPSVDETETFWATHDGCAATRRELETREIVCDATDHETHVERYSGCSAGTSVELWRMQGAGHIPLFRVPDWPLGVIDFLFAHTR